MTQMTKYYKVTSSKIKAVMYYAAYTEDTVIKKAQLDFGDDQIEFDITEIESPPEDRLIHCCSDLSYEDVKEVARRFYE